MDIQNIHHLTSKYIRQLLTHLDFFPSLFFRWSKTFRYFGSICSHLFPPLFADVVNRTTTSTVHEEVEEDNLTRTASANEGWKKSTKVSIKLDIDRSFLISIVDKNKKGMNEGWVLFYPSTIIWLPFLVSIILPHLIEILLYRPNKVQITE